jgi:pilus assembly protein CpaB
MTYRVRNIGIAVALAAVAALLTSFYVANYKRHVQQGEQHVTVLVAKRDIPAGTSGSEVAGKHLLATQEVARRNVVPGAISSPNQIGNLVASQATYAGEQVTARRFSPLAQNGLHGELKGAMRAFQIQGDQNQMLAGTLKDGDHVDLVAAMQSKHGEADQTYSRVVLRNLKVLRAPGAPAPGSKLTGGVDQNFAAVLALSDSQAQKFQLVLATTSSGSGGSAWHLELRPVVHDSDSPDHLDSVPTVLTDGLNAYQRRVFGR